MQNRHVHQRERGRELEKFGDIEQTNKSWATVLKRKNSNTNFI